MAIANIVRQVHLALGFSGKPRLCVSIEPNGYHFWSFDGDFWYLNLVSDAWAASFSSTFFCITFRVCKWIRSMHGFTRIPLGHFYSNRVGRAEKTCAESVYGFSNGTLSLDTFATSPTWLTCAILLPVVDISLILYNIFVCTKVRPGGNVRNLWVIMYYQHQDLVKSLWNFMKSNRVARWACSQ